MKKGTQIHRVVIDASNGKITAYARVRGGVEFEFPLTRRQRDIFRRFKSGDFRDQVFKEFGVTDIIPDVLTVDSVLGSGTIHYSV